MFCNFGQKIAQAQVDNVGGRKYKKKGGKNTKIQKGGKKTQIQKVTKRQKGATKSSGEQCWGHWTDAN